MTFKITGGEILSAIQNNWEYPKENRNSYCAPKVRNLQVNSPEI